MDRKAYWYSVIRYAPDELSGEILNVGVVIHSIEDDTNTKFLLLEESSPKVRAILNTKTDETIYKSFKDILEYYMEESVKDLRGNVGKFQLSSPYSPEYLMTLYEFFKNKKMNLSEPTFSLSDDIDGLFKSIFMAYVGEKYYPIKEKEKNIKSIIRGIFEDRHFLNTKVKQDIGITPLKDLPLKINIDFGFKNGVWNYLQAIPSLNSSSKSTEWFAKTKFLIENIGDDAKVYLMYRNSDKNENRETIDLINYFNAENQRVIGLDLADPEPIERLCMKIENEAHDLNKVS